MVEEHELTKEMGKNEALTSEQIFRNEHAASSGARKVIDGPITFQADGVRTKDPITGVAGAASADLAMEANKAYRMIGSVDLYFRLSKGGSTAVVGDIYLPANTVMIIKSGTQWDTVSVIKTTAAAVGEVQLMEVV